MTLLSICQAVCNAGQVAAPTSIINNTDETAKFLLALSNRGGQIIARRPQGGWVSMIREYDFVTQAVLQQPGMITNSAGLGLISGISTPVIAGGANPGQITPGNWIASGTGVPNNAVVKAITVTSVGPPAVYSIAFNQPATQTGAGEFTFGQSDYPLPFDFVRPVDNTFWDRSRFWSMRGPQSPQQWQLYKSSVIGRASIQRRFRFRSIRQLVQPYLYDDFGNIIFDDNGNPEFSSGNPVLQSVTMLSIDPVPFDNGSALVFEYVSSGWCQSEEGTPQTSWQADTDVGVVDEFLLELDLQWRMLRRLGLSYSEELDEFERQISKELGVDGGSAILDLTPNNQLSLIGPWNLPETGYGGTPS
jgi:hypothetical protein